MHRGMKLAPNEAEHLANVAAKVFNQYGPKPDEQVTAREVWITAFLHGIQYIYEDMGILEQSNHDNERIYKFLEDHNL